MTKKYRILTNDSIELGGKFLFRIRALRDFGDVKEGDLGGYVESEDNLSHNGNAWIDEDAWVYGNAYVHDDARVYGNAQVCENARISKNACVFGNARIYGDANVTDHAHVSGLARVFGRAHVLDNASVYERAMIYDYSQVYGFAQVYGSAQVRDRAKVLDDAQVYGTITEISGRAVICGDAKVATSNDYILFKNNWSSMRYFTYTHSNQMWTVGCFHGTSDELVEKAYRDSELSGTCYKQYVDLVNAIYNKLENE